MSECAGHNSVSRFLGISPGHAGYNNGGQLTEVVCGKPHNAVLLDEVEKAHPHALAVLL